MCRRQRSDARAGETAGTAGEVAELIWFLVSDYSDHFSGTEVYIDGAQSLLPG